MERLTARRPDNGLAYLAKVKANEQEVDSPFPNTLKCILESFKRLAAYEDTDLTPDEIPHWIPVSERLPEVNTRVLVWGKEHKEAVVAVFNEDGIWAIAHGWGVVYGVTHWMPLPQPPKEEK